MATDVIMPQMGESIAEGTIVKGSRRWETRSPATSLCSRSRPTSRRRDPVARIGHPSEIRSEEGQTVRSTRSSV